MAASGFDCTGCGRPERVTAAHSTVQINGVDSSEVWGGFRVARRARPFDVVVSDADAHDATPGCQVTAAHDGYRRLPGRPVHRRSWCLTGDGLAVIDTLEGDYTEAVARFHLHPAVQIAMDQTAPGDAADSDTITNPDFPANGEVKSDDCATGALSLPDGQSVAWRVTGSQVRLVGSHWHPQFGLSEPSQCLEVSISGRECRLELLWATQT